MAGYQQLSDPITGEVTPTVRRTVDGAFIPPDPANRDRAEFDAWVAEGNTPDPPEPAPEPLEPDTLPAPPSADTIALQEQIDVLVQRMEAVEARLTELGA